MIFVGEKKINTYIIYILKNKSLYVSRLLARKKEMRFAGYKKINIYIIYTSEKTGRHVSVFRFFYCTNV